MRPRRYKAAEELYEAVIGVLDQNDNMRNTGPWLDASFRRPLVRAANNYAAVTGKMTPSERRRHERGTQ